MYQSQIGKQIEVSKQAISSTVVKLQKEEYIELIMRSSYKQYRLSQKGVAILAEAKSTTSSDCSKPSLTSIRIHNFFIKYELREPIDKDTTKLLASRGVAYTPLPLANHTDSYFKPDDYQALLTPSSLEIHIPDLKGLSLNTDLITVTLAAYARLDSLIAKIERMLGIHVRRIDKNTLIADVSKLHIAIVDHKFAERVNEIGDKLEVWIGNELRVIVDKSHGFNELETVSKRHAIEDAQKLVHFTEAVLTGEFDYKKDHELLHMTIGIVNSYGVNVQSHVEAIKKLTEVAEEARVAIKQLGQQGSRRGRRTVLTEEQKANICKLADTGLNYYRIAKELNLNKGSVHYFLAKKGLLNNTKSSEATQLPDDAD